MTGKKLNFPLQKTTFACVTWQESAVASYIAQCTTSESVNRLFIRADKPEAKSFTRPDDTTSTCKEMQFFFTTFFMSTPE